MIHRRRQGRMPRVDCPCRGVRRGALSLALALLVLLPLGSAMPGGPLSSGRALASEAFPGPRVMLCLYDTQGQLLAGSMNCPIQVTRRDAMLPRAHCFYDIQGFLWRGLPRCPPRAPPFLLEEAHRPPPEPQG